MPCAVRELGNLEPSRYTIFVEYELNGSSMKAIAAEQGISINTAWNRLRLAREQLQSFVLRRMAAGVEFPAWVVNKLSLRHNGRAQQRANGG